MFGRRSKTRRMTGAEKRRESVMASLGNTGGKAGIMQRHSRAIWSVNRSALQSYAKPRPMQAHRQMVRRTDKAWYFDAQRDDPLARRRDMQRGYRATAKWRHKPWWERMWH